MSRRTRVLFLPALTTLLLVPAAFGADAIDLKRIEPVPADEPIPLQDFFRPLALQEPKLNLTGTHIAAIITAGEDKHELLVYELKTQKTEAIGGFGDKDIYDFHWLNERRLIFSLSREKLYGLGLFAANVGELTRAYPLLQYCGSRLVAIPPQNRLQPLVWNRRDSLETEKDLGVSAINTDLSSGKLIDLYRSMNDLDYMAAREKVRDNNDRHTQRTYPVPGGGLGTGYLADKDGQLEFAFTMQNGVEKMLRLVDRHWEPCPVNLDEIDVITCGDKPGQLVVLGPRQEGKPRALQFMDGATGQLGEVLLQDKAYDFYSAGSSNGRLYRDPVSRVIIGAMFERNGPSVVWFTEEYRALQKILNGFFPGMVVRIIGSDEAQKLFLVATFSDRQPVIYNWVDLEARKAGLIKRSAPWIEARRMQPMNILQFKTRDGHQLDAYLTLPAGASKKNPPPLVVLPHGGPWVRDSWGFDGEVQFLASRGYAVLQPNYRGSLGTAWLFPYRDQWELRKMHDDVTDATKALIASGLIDRNRVAIMGASFGGFLALSGVVNEPELYRCAVTIAGVFDYEQVIREEKYDQYDSPAYGYFLRYLGDPKKEPEKFDAFAPVRHVDRVRVPVFVAHGKDDNVAEITQSKRLVSELEKHHVPFEKLFVSGEGHGMGHLKNEVELYGRIEVFLAKNLMAAPAAAPAAASGGAP